NETNKRTCFLWYSYYLRTSYYNLDSYVDALKCLFEKYDFYFVTYIYPLLWYKNIYTMKKIKYTEKRLRNNFRIGLLFIALGIMFFLIPYVVGVGKYDFLFKAVGIGEIAGGIFGLIIYYYES